MICYSSCRHQFKDTFHFTSEEGVWARLCWFIFHDTFTITSCQGDARGIFVQSITDWKEVLRKENLRIWRIFYHYCLSQTVTLYVWKHCLCLKRIFQKLVVSLKKQTSPNYWKTEVGIQRITAKGKCTGLCPQKHMAGSASVSSTLIDPVQYPVNVVSKSVLPLAGGLCDLSAYFCVLVALWLVCAAVSELLSALTVSVHVRLASVCH